MLHPFHLQSFGGWLLLTHLVTTSGIAAPMEALIAGEVTTDGAVLHARLFAPANAATPHLFPVAEPLWLRFEVAEELNGFERPVAVTAWTPLSPASDHILAAAVHGLRADRWWHYRVTARPPGDEPTDATVVSPVARFRTLPEPEAPAALRLVFGNCMHFARYWASDDALRPDAALGFPAWVALDAAQPDYVVFAGDNVYYDHAPRAVDQDGLRAKWHEMLRFPRLQTLLAGRSSYWLKDDHDYRADDAFPAQSIAPSHELGVATFREQVPVVDPATPDVPTYRTHRLGQALQVWFLEGRDYRDANDAPDGPSKTMWGEAQRAWLQATLRASDAPFKLIVSPTPMVGPDDARKNDNHTNTAGGGGFRAEGEAFFAWLRDSGFEPDEVFVVCGDRHWLYHSIHPTGFHELSMGSMLDGNARTGRAPGDADSTDPEGRIGQPFSSSPATGGFLEVNVARMPDGTNTLQAVWRDEYGVELHRHTASR